MGVKAAAGCLDILCKNLWRTRLTLIDYCLSRVVDGTVTASRMVGLVFNKIPAQTGCIRTFWKFIA